MPGRKRRKHSPVTVRETETQACVPVWARGSGGRGDRHPWQLIESTFYVGLSEIV